MRVVRGSAPARRSNCFPRGAAETHSQYRASRFGPCDPAARSVCVAGSRGLGERCVSPSFESPTPPRLADTPPPTQAGAGTHEGRVEVNLLPRRSCEAYQK